MSRQQFTDKFGVDPEDIYYWDWEVGIATAPYDLLQMDVNDYKAKRSQ